MEREEEGFIQFLQATYWDGPGKISINEEIALGGSLYRDKRDAIRKKLVGQGRKSISFDASRERGARANCACFREGTRANWPRSLGNR